MTTTVRRFLRSQYFWPALLLAVGLGMALNEWLYQRSSAVSSQLTTLVSQRGTVNRLLVNLADLDMAFRVCVRLGASDSCQGIAPLRQAVSKDLQAIRGTTLLPSNPQRASTLSSAVMARLDHIQRTMDVHAREGAAAALALFDAPSAPGRSADVETSIGREVLIEIDRGVTDSDRRLRVGLTTYRLGIAAMILLFAAGVMLYRRQVMAVFVLREERLRELARAHVRLGEVVADRTRDLHELARHLQTAREDERRSLARELHDELGALLTAAKMDLARVRSKVPLNDEGKQRLQHLSTMLDQGIELKRRIIEDLRPSALDGLGLLPALQSLCVSARERLGVGFDLSLDPAVKLGPEASLAVYRLVQEALTNIAKYAAARQVALRASVEGESAIVEVSDDGCGFDLDAVAVGRHGLPGMRFRIESLGGTMTVISCPGEGTTIRASLPNGVAPDPEPDPEPDPQPDDEPAVADTPLAGPPQARRDAGASSLAPSS